MASDGVSGHAHGAFGPNGEPAIVWTQGLANRLITSPGLGQPFGMVQVRGSRGENDGEVVEGPTASDIMFEGNTLFVASYGPLNLAFAVDKSCDGGMTWRAALSS